MINLRLDIIVMLGMMICLDVSYKLIKNVMFLLLGYGSYILSIWLEMKYNIGWTIILILGSLIYNAIFNKK